MIMDKENPYVGEHTPSIQLDGSGKKGLRQAGPGLKKGRVSSGYILLAGEDATIQISLVWGSEVDQSQSVKFDHLSSDFSKYIF